LAAWLGFINAHSSSVVISLATCLSSNDCVSSSLLRAILARV